jgi:hypothetical protein
VKNAARLHKAEYADILSVYGFCDGSATPSVEEHRRRFPMCSISDPLVSSKAFSSLRERCTLPSVHVSPERAHQLHAEEQGTFLKWYSVVLLVQVVLLLARENFLHVSVFHEHVCGEYCMMTGCTHFTQSVRKICAQGTVPYV